jgi:hypothetical protein
LIEAASNAGDVVSVARPWVRLEGATNKVRTTKAHVRPWSGLGFKFFVMGS